MFVSGSLYRQLTGPPAPSAWRGHLPEVPYLLGPGDPSFRLQLGVHNIRQSVMINNVFGCIEGKFEPGTAGTEFGVGRQGREKGVLGFLQVRLISCDPFVPLLRTR